MVPPDAAALARPAAPCALPFTKMAGCGNDFVIVAATDVPPGADLSALGRRVCDRRNGVGADGLIVVGPAAGAADYEVTIINAGGLPAEMCGNGARCVARWAVERGLAPAEHRFETVAGPIRAAVGPSEVRVRLTDPTDEALGTAVEVGGEIRSVDSIDTGVPHAVLWVEDVEAADVGGLGLALRWHGAFPRGTNVNLVQVERDGLAVRTYERGVEAETLSCGTGSAAAAILGWRRGFVRPPVRVRTRHGGILTIDFAVEPDGAVRDVHLTGQTTTICRGEIGAELLE